MKSSSGHQPPLANVCFAASSQHSLLEPPSCRPNSLIPTAASLRRRN